MRFALIIGIVILLVFIFTELNNRKMKKYSQEIEKLIRDAYKKSWGAGAGMKILGIHKLTGKERIINPVYLVVIKANGKFISVLSEITLEKKSMFHKKLTEKEKKNFLDANSKYSKKYDEFMENYKEYLK